VDAGKLEEAAVRIQSPTDIPDISILTMKVKISNSGRVPMIVCHCKGITDRDLKRALHEGTFDQGESGGTARAGGDCGTCQPLIDEIVGKHGPRKSAPAPKQPDNS
jgi:bacterioferritin-associated ferredoxin